MVTKTIKPGTEQYNECLKLKEDLLLKPLGKVFSQEEISQEESNECIAMYLEKRLVGTCSLIQEGRVLKIENFVISPQFQNKGYGGRILNFCAKYALDNDCSVMYCEVEETMQKFYQKYGFRIDNQDTTTKRTKLRLRVN